MMIKIKYLFIKRIILIIIIIIIIMIVIIKGSYKYIINKILFIVIDNIKNI